MTTPQRAGTPAPAPRPVPAGAPSGAHALAAEDFRTLRALVAAHCGLAFADDASYLLEKRLGPRVEVHGLDGFAAYCRFLRDDPAGAAEMEAVVDALATHETYLYREAPQLDAFAARILPALATHNERQRRIRIWSAGCSTGEEVYTIAALVARSGLFPGWDVDVMGTDIVRRVLSVARAGVYAPRAFRAPESEALRSWFEPVEGNWRVKGELREVVRFARLNLLDPRAEARVGRVDVVFCRNVLIYLDGEARRRVLRTFWNRLREGGWLLLGHAEALLDFGGDFEFAEIEGHLVYRKPLRPS